jgi:hypothetical protein
MRATETDGGQVLLFRVGEGAVVHRQLFAWEGGREEGNEGGREEGNEGGRE